MLTVQTLSLHPRSCFFPRCIDRWFQTHSRVAPTNWQKTPFRRHLSITFPSFLGLITYNQIFEGLKLKTFISCQKLEEHDWKTSKLSDIKKTYCWWKKSCTSWHGKYQILYRVSKTSQVVVSRISEPSTVGKHQLKISNGQTHVSTSGSSWPASQLTAM